MRVFVTGGSGFVGGALIAALRRRGDEVRALARSAAAEATVRAAGAMPVGGDLFAHDALRRGMTGCDLVVHAAGAVDVGGRLAELERLHVGGTQAVLDAARAAGVPRFVLVSAASVILDGTPIFDADEECPFPRRPAGPYSATKAAAERLVLSANGAALRTVAVRPPGIWGVGDPSILPAMVALARKGQFVWFDRGRYLYSFCHVENVCAGLLAAAERGRGGDAYFVTDGPSVAFRGFVTDLLRTQGVVPGGRSLPWGVVKALGAGLEGMWRLARRPAPPPLTREAAILMGPYTVRDDKARRELGYTAPVSREAGLAALAATDGRTKSRHGVPPPGS